MLDMRKKRLFYQSTHRGCKEVDLLLEPFVSKHLDSMSKNDLDWYETFLAEADWDIYAWLVSDKPLPKHHQNMWTKKMIR